MMKRKILCIILVAAAVLSLCGCSDSNGEGQRFVYPIDNDPVYLDPQIVSDSGGRSIIANSFEGLVRLDESGNIVPGVAEKWTVSDNGLVYTFNLRHDAQWYISGDAEDFLGEEYVKTFNTAVTSDDFAFALTRALSPDTSSLYAQSLAGIKNASEVLAGNSSVSSLGIETPDGYTLVITLEVPDDDFLSVLTTPVCMPCNRQFFEKTGGRYGITTDYLIYNGPLYISVWNAGTNVTLRKNPSYSGDCKVTAGSVYFSINNEADTRLDKLLDGTYDVTPLTGVLAAEAAKKKKITLYEVSNSVKSLLANCGDETLGNENVRKALSQSLDLNVLSYSAADAKGIVPACCTAAGKNYREQVGAVKMPVLNEKKAKESWDKALSELKTTEIDVTVLCSTDDETAVRTVMQTWQSIFGVSLAVRVEAVDEPTLRQRVASGNYQLAYAAIKSDDVLAMGFLRSFTTDAVNSLTFYADEEYDGLISSAATAVSSQKRLSLMLSAEQQLVDNAVVLPVVNSSEYYGGRSGVSGIYFSPSGELVYFAQGLKYE